MPGGEKDLAWFATDGTEVPAAVWISAETRTVGMFVSGALRSRSDRGERITEPSLFVILNSSPDPVDFTMPARPYGPAFDPIINTGRPDGRPGPEGRIAPSGAIVIVPARSVMVYQTVPMPKIERRRSKRL